jgi:hypothetical protein
MFGIDNLNSNCNKTLLKRACAHEEEIFCIMHLIASSNTFINKNTKEDNAFI